MRLFASVMLWRVVVASLSLAVFVTTGVVYMSGH